MKLFDIYTWSTGKQASFLNNFNGNDQLYAQAQQFWNTLESNAIVYFAIFFLLGIGLAYYYYTPFREALSSKMVGDILGCMLCINLAVDIGGCISDCDSEVRRSIHIGIETFFSKLSLRVCSICLNLLDLL